MLRDLGSRDAEFIGIVADIRQRLLALAGVADAGYEAILMQGSGTFGIEAVLSSCIPPAASCLSSVNGAYGRRMAQIARAHGIACRTIDFAENAWPDLAAVEQAVQADGGLYPYRHRALGNDQRPSKPPCGAGELARRNGLVFIVDAVSSFGGMPLNPAGPTSIFSSHRPTNAFRACRVFALFWRGARPCWQPRAGRAA